MSAFLLALLYLPPQAPEMDCAGRTCATPTQAPPVVVVVTAARQRAPGAVVRQTVTRVRRGTLRPQVYTTSRVRSVRSSNC